LDDQGVERGPLTDTVARTFVEARLAARPLADFPGALPPDLATGYRHQEAAIALWPDEIVGWKIGRVGADFEDRHGRTRLAGPIFSRQLRRAGREPVAFPVFEGGFAAIEAEFVLVVGRDAPAAKADWTTEEARALVGAMHIGIETAGSPLATINALGPTVVVSDFGNNAGLILGPSVTDWRSRSDASLTCESFIDGVSVGTGAAADLPGGPIESLRFLLEHCAKRGRPLKAGMLISTGAATGIHDIAAGQRSRVDFGPLGTIECKAVTAQAEAAAVRAARA
jgi:2-keto-4-pentenoate hydratase